jgi:hypothetical protein
LEIEEEKDLRKLPFDKLLYLLVSYIAMLIISFLKGSEKMKSIIDIEVYIIYNLDARGAIGLSIYHTSL